jgi:hypothetical protein
LHVADIAEGHAVVDCRRCATKPAILDDDLAEHHEARRAELGVEVSERRVQVRHDIADLE